MDSRLLNVFRDDPFDEPYAKYENGTEFWTNDCDNMSLQLTETLNGILPIGAVEDDTDIYSNLMVKDDIQSIERDVINTNTKLKNMLAPEDDNENDSDINNAVNNHFQYDNIDNIDCQSICSDNTFRTRTSSSSIGDYESHTSDYDDEDNNNVDDNYNDVEENEYSVYSIEDGVYDFDANMVKYEEDEFVTSLFEAEAILSDKNLDLPVENLVVEKNRTISTNTSGSDADGLQVDPNTFDLAEFITKDDFNLNEENNSHHDIIPIEENLIQSKQIVKLENSAGVLKYEDSDSESDIIVDVETVENEEEDKSLLSCVKTEVDDVQYIDNVKEDPSWSPTMQKKTTIITKEAKTSKVTVANQQKPISNVPNKKQIDFLKQRFGSGNGKPNINTQRNGKLAAKNTTDLSKSVTSINEVNIGIGRGGKNLSLLKHQRETDSGADEKCSSVSEKASIQEPKKSEMSEDKIQAMKRKLDLNEYKMRRVGNTVATPLPQSYKIPKINNNILSVKTTQITNNGTKVVPISPTKHSEAVTSIVKSLREQPNKKIPIDPITEAKNKVLRMQEIKKAKQLKIIDSTVSSKVPKVTKILPLKDLMKGTFIAEQHSTSNSSLNVPLKTHSDYEEIILLSASCNTDITIPPKNKHYSDISRSLLKSNVLLYNISDTFQKVQATENITISQNSLIASIQNVVANKGLPLPITTLLTDKISVPNKTDNKSKNMIQHGEDKIIMHLPKNRTRKLTRCISTQTDLILEFPVLPMPKKIENARRSREKTRLNKTSRNYRKREDINSVISNSSSDSDRSLSPGHVNQLNGSTSSAERTRFTDNAGGYSSRSSRRHRSSVSSSYSDSERTNFNCSKRFASQKQRSRKITRSSSSSSSDHSDCSYSRDRSRSPIYDKRTRTRKCSFKSRNNAPKPAVEERRIVYVGRIEEETTKELLRRKFLTYGTIKQITIHYKENGMKYGFVTYERSQDAFAVIDNSLRDPLINMYDISFGGRRAFCRASYADLDNAGINTYQSVVFPCAPEPIKKEDSFEELLLKVKAKMNASKPATNSTNDVKI
ncbi:uncharacterized protein LOC119683496 [Teleopsis dalmanni]|uniref:uncharacterized protein LOC119683496 n=1 Tax=Teleopsis dalmanni TaxID=139649 RepID=UPI0018CF92A4|nr:uncharacterized protein LOC119683496 [Teleopsis dalmanni]XP_037953109.1 uncharacterized protein LOC119683496 [Teleopsis dalmanni]XP_037953110.1 uncharacterized protein LOC119683496 [Teleopsis dalmanni]